MPNNRNENVELRLDTNTLRPLSGAGRKLFVETYGCQMNVGDTEIVVSVMQREGYVYTERIDEADVILINTCSIRSVYTYPSRCITETTISVSPTFIWQP